MNEIIKLDTTERAVAYGEKLARMIRVETISNRFEKDRTKFYNFHKLLEELFPNVHSVCEKHDFNGSLLFKWSGSSKDKEPILLMSHMDVVEASGEWEHEPFSGDIDEEGRVWGRGTVDTKASLFCVFTAIEEMIGEGHVPSRDVYIASSCTEEWSGDGAPSIVEYLKSQGIVLDYLIDEGGMIVEEPMAGVQGVYGMVGVVEKGYGDFKFIAHGHGGHASAPKKNSPLVRLGKFMVHVEKKSPFKNEFPPTLLEMFRRMTPNMKGPLKIVLKNMWLFKPLLKKVLPMVNSTAGAMTHTTLAFTMAKGSDGFNVLPQEAYVTGNMRFIHHQPNKESIEALKKIADKYDVEIEAVYQDEPCPVVDYKSEAFKLVEDVTKEVYPGVVISPYIMTGGTDAKYYRDVCKNCLRFAPLYINPQQFASVHAANENIYRGALSGGVDFYKAVIRRG